MHHASLVADQENGCREYHQLVQYFYAASRSVDFSPPSFPPSQDVSVRLNVHEMPVPSSVSETSDRFVGLLVSRGLANIYQDFSRSLDYEQAAGRYPVDRVSGPWYNEGMGGNWIGTIVIFASSGLPQWSTVGWCISLVVLMLVISSGSSSNC